MPSEEVEVEWDFIHPEYPEHSMLRAMFVVDLYYEPADRSVGIMSDGIYEDGWILQKAVMVSDEDESLDLEIDTEVVEFLYPEDLWEYLTKQMTETAVEQAYDRADDDY